MHYGLDLDDGTVPFNLPFIQWINGRYGTSFRYEDIVTNNFPECPAFKHLGWDYPRWKAEVDAYSSTDEFMQLPPLPGALEGIQYLASQGHRFSVVTGRDASKLRDRTALWLQEHLKGITLGAVVFTNHYGGGVKRKKSEVCKELGIDALVEDHFEHASDCASAGIKVVLLQHPWNAKGREQMRSGEHSALREQITEVTCWKGVMQYLLGITAF